MRARLGAALLKTQRPDGAWQIYHDAANGDINATVEAYAALRSLGHRDDEPALTQGARLDRVQGRPAQHPRVHPLLAGADRRMAVGEDAEPAAGGDLVPAVVSVLDLQFRAMGARDADADRAVVGAPPEPAAAAAKTGSTRCFPAGATASTTTLPKKADAGGWDRFFRGADKVLHALQAFGARTKLALWRPAAVAHALEWIVRHQDADGAWGGIQPPWIYSLMALHVEGYALDHPVLAKGLAGLNDPAWRWDEGEATFIGATNSPVWDTMLTLLAFDDAGLTGEYPAEVEKAAEWLLARQVRVKGDWSVKLPNVEPGGWAFEYCNNSYPDIDDTAVALIALAPFRNDPKFKAQGHRRGLRPRASIG